MDQGLLTRRIILGSNFAFAPIEKSRVSGDGFVKVEGGVLKTRSNANNELAFGWFPLTVGLEGYVEVLFEAKRVSGSSTDFLQSGGVGYFAFDTNKPVSGISGNVQDWTKIKSSEWKSYRFVIPSQLTTPFVAIVFGCFTNSIGEFWFRRFEINVYNGPQSQPDMRVGKIIKDGSGWRVDKDPQGSSNIGMKSIEVQSTYLRVHYDWIQAWNDPIVVCSIDASSGRAGWIAQPAGINREASTIQIINSSGSVVAPSSISTIFINVMVMGA